MSALGGGSCLGNVFGQVHPLTCRSPSLPGNGGWACSSLCVEICTFLFPDLHPLLLLSWQRLSSGSGKRGGAFLISSSLQCGPSHQDGAHPEKALQVEARDGVRLPSQPCSPRDRPPQGPLAPAPSGPRETPSIFTITSETPPPSLALPFTAPAVSIPDAPGSLPEGGAPLQPLKPSSLGGQFQ